ncbi:MAG: Mur ligase family protein [Thermomicrobiales bacterium]|nr:Mur ligase family protein [Thermomicrobiales bacterium]
MAPDTPNRPDPRLTAALIAAKAAGLVIRRMGRGGGTAAPGLIADRIDPGLLAKICDRLPSGVLVVAGTNGKTTTSRMIADILEADGHRVAHNRTGSNLVRGVASALAGRSSLSGDPRADVGVIESDEAALPAILRLTHPRVLALNNLFRDQLDRYGELNAIAVSWRAAFERLGPETTIVANGDDPTLAAITEGLVARRVLFGLDDPASRHRLTALPHAADAATCRRCGADLAYDALYSAHLGDWRCAGCAAARPLLDVAGRDIVLDGVDALQTVVDWPGAGEPLPISVAIPGMYNVYNTVCAVAAATCMGASRAAIADALASFRSAFGRIERVRYRDRNLVMALVKNPVGFNETLRMLITASGRLETPTLIAINDLHADGRDISWLWDVDFEQLADGATPLYTAGLRGADMANRLKYAGVAADRLHPLTNDLAVALDEFVERTPVGETAYVLPSYTAMLALRKVLSDRGAVETFWRQ